MYNWGALIGISHCFPILHGFYGNLVGVITDIVYGILYLAMWRGGTPGPFAGIQPTRKSRTDVSLFYGTSTVTERD